MRTVALMIDGEDLENILHVAAVPREEYERALGYLTQWAEEAYAHVLIYSPYPKEGELVAVYRREEKAGPADYVIGAIWHEDSGATSEEGYPRAGHYGFHS